MEQTQSFTPNKACYSELNQLDTGLSSCEASAATTFIVSKNQATPMEDEREDTQDTQPLQIPPTEASRQWCTTFSIFSVPRWWLLELIASILSIASLISIVALLRHHNGRGLGDVNLPKRLTLNGILAVISTLNRACLMVPVSAAMSQEAWLWFSAHDQNRHSSSRLGDLDLSDAASRGSRGSFIFLLSARGHRLLACLGALITILSLTFGTFTQQLLAIESLPVVDPLSKLAPGNIPRSETWMNYSGSNGWGLKPTLNMKGAILNGLYTDNISPIAAVCPTGNCTWPKTSSLAVCGQCVRSSYRTECASEVSRIETHGSMCNYTMPSGSSMVIIQTDSTRNVPLSYFGFKVTTGKGGYFNQSLNKRLYLATFDLFGAPNYVNHAVFWPQEKWSNASTVSSECALWMCVQIYNITMQSGQQVQTVVSSFDDLVNMSAIPSVFQPLPADVNGADTTNFAVGYSSWFALSAYLAAQMNGTALLISQPLPSTDTIEVIWNATTNLDGWIQNVATSITNIIRTDTPLSRAVFNGTAYQLAYVVRWEWLALPAALVLLSVLFWSAIIVKTARSPIEAWKGGAPYSFAI
ncbi:hypothetical protein EJ08DRAFT_682680 [Tothia fuscella]|uniref:Uncharacterized protein n=1 Tax=Tothia fuscella TaxID=1048955 RepID=A0A9P4NHY7_9PEZI|nr:hypothetical protein EJ08DRAFT_682680 [Tothia fuscella]